MTCWGPAGVLTVLVAEPAPEVALVCVALVVFVTAEPPCWSRSERPDDCEALPPDKLEELPTDFVTVLAAGLAAEPLEPMLLPPSREPGPRPNPPGSAATVFTDGADEAPVEDAGAGVVEGFEGLAPVLLPLGLPGICHGPRGSLGLLGPRPLPWLPLGLLEPDCVSP